MKVKNKKWLSIVISLVMVLMLSTFFVGGVAAGSSSCPPSLLDSVNIGNLTSETGHNLQGWTNIWAGYGWSGPDGNMRLIWGDGGEPATPEYNWASVDLDAGCKTALSLKMQHLDGAADDGFNVYVNNTLVGTYVDQYSSNTWTSTVFDLSAWNFTGLLTVKLEATAPMWRWGHIYGQVAFNVIELHGADTTPPTISVSVNPNTLWPPSHKMIGITATVAAQDSCDLAPSVVLTSVTSNEADDAVGDGDGNTVNDIQDAAIGTEDYSFSLRAERAGSGNGRVYTITYTATDVCGNSASASATVTVPHDQD